MSHYPRSTSHSSANGIHYFAQGWKLALLPGIKRFVFLPLLVNILFMGGAFWWLLGHISSWINLFLSYTPHWLQWVSYLLWPIAIFTILIVFGYLFSTITHWIAAPFNGLLAEQLEAKLIGKAETDMTLLQLIRDLPRIMKRELQKFLYYLPRVLLILALTFLPVAGQFVVPVLLFVFSAWMQAIQYNDYSFDNHKVTFSVMRQTLQQHRFHQLQFGTLVMLFTAIPFLNLVIMPIAICGATAMWVDRYREQFLNGQQ